jgi:hypothetical protein
MNIIRCCISLLNSLGSVKIFLYLFKKTFNIYLFSFDKLASLIHFSIFLSNLLTILVVVVYTNSLISVKIENLTSLLLYLIVIFLSNKLST